MPQGNGVGLVGLAQRRHPAQPLLPRFALKSLVAGGQNFRLQGQAFKGDIVLFGPIANEPFVRVTLSPACAVIHVGDHKGMPQFLEQVKQHRGIAPAARPHHELCSRRNLACAELALHFLEQDVHGSKQFRRA